MFGSQYMRMSHLFPLCVALAAPLNAQTTAAPAPSAPTAPSATAAARPPAGPFVKAEADAVVAELATQLEDNFVFPDVGKQYAAMLRANLTAGKYASFADADEFAKTVTADLQAVHKDGHLHLRAPHPESGGKRQPIGDLGSQNGITKSGWIADRVAYIAFNLFPGNEVTLNELRKFLEAHKTAKALIIDARGHRGGGLAEMGMMFPYLFSRDTVLLDMDTRRAAFESGAATDDPAFVRAVAAPQGIVRREHFVVPRSDAGMLPHAKVYLLTSKRTGSAGEHLALALKRSHRATLIGESTYGAGHFGGFILLGHGYAAFIPVGRTFDPDTGEGWEGTGVKPDVAVPADKALDEALKLVGVNATAQVALANLR